MAGAAEHVELPIRVHDLFLGMAGRVDDDALSAARELLAVGELTGAMEMLLGCLVAGRVVTSPREQELLGDLLRAVNSDPALTGNLKVRDSWMAQQHRFSTEDSPDRGVASAIRPVLDTLPGIESISCVWRVTPAGAAPCALPQRVVLIELGQEGLPTATSYRVHHALAAAGIHAVVEVLRPGVGRGDYHARAMGEAHGIDHGGGSNPRPEQQSQQGHGRPPTSHGRRAGTRLAAEPVSGGELVAPASGFERSERQPAEDRPLGRPKPVAKRASVTRIQSRPSEAPRSIEAAPDQSTYENQAPPQSQAPSQNQSPGQQQGSAQPQHHAGPQQTPAPQQSHASEGQSHRPSTGQASPVSAHPESDSPSSGSTDTANESGSPSSGLTAEPMNAPVTAEPKVVEPTITESTITQHRIENGAASVSPAGLATPAAEPAAQAEPATVAPPVYGRTEAAHASATSGGGAAETRTSVRPVRDLHSHLRGQSTSSGLRSVDTEDSAGEQAGNDHADSSLGHEPASAHFASTELAGIGPVPMESSRPATERGSGGHAAHEPEATTAHPVAVPEQSAKRRAPEMPQSVSKNLNDKERDLLRQLHEELAQREQRERQDSKRWQLARPPQGRENVPPVSGATAWPPLAAEETMINGTPPGGWQGPHPST